MPSGAKEQAYFLHMLFHLKNKKSVPFPESLQHASVTTPRVSQETALSLSWPTNAQHMGAGLRP